MDDRRFRLLLDWFGLSRDGYYRVRKGVKKRIGRHMLECGCRNVSTYLMRLTQDRTLREQCRTLLNVSISRFFRDRALWQLLQEEILPELINAGVDPFRVWSAGCARGEEIYSFKMVWDLLGHGRDSMPQLQAWATDMNQECIDAARRGVYSASSLKEVPDELKQRYFERLPKKSLLAIRESVKGGISWRCLDLVADEPPAQDFHMVFLRNNILTYCGEVLLDAALPKIWEASAQGGYLIIGSKEKWPPEGGPLHPHAGHPGLLMK